MKELEEYRLNLLTRLENAAKVFREECLAVPDPYAPLEPGGWNVHQVAAHARDVDKFVYGLRVRRTALENNPEFPNFDGDLYMANNYNAAESLQALLDELVENVEALIELLRTLPKGAWSRISRHTTLGSGITLQTWAEKDLAHLEEHLEGVRRGNQR